MNQSVFLVVCFSVCRWSRFFHQGYAFSNCTKFAAIASNSLGISLTLSPVDRTSSESLVLSFSVCRCTPKVCHASSNQGYACSNCTKFATIASNSLGISLALSPVDRTSSESLVLSFPNIIDTFLNHQTSNQ